MFIVFLNIDLVHFFSSYKPLSITSAFDRFYANIHDLPNSKIAHKTIFFQLRFPFPQSAVAGDDVDYDCTTMLTSCGAVTFVHKTDLQLLQTQTVLVSNLLCSQNLSMEGTNEHFQPH